MKWFRIPKETSKSPSKGIYSDWKPLLAKEGKFQCVYCAIHEKNFGDIRNFHVEHFRPKSIYRFQHLINEFSNLYYACSICNCFKGNDWPNEPPSKSSKPIIHYPEPSKINYNQLFEVHSNWTLEGKTVASKYLVEKLYLNRPQLILERRSKALLIGLQHETLKLQLLSKQIGESSLSQEMKDSLHLDCINLLANAVTLLIKNDSIRPYRTEGITR